MRPTLNMEKTHKTYSNKIAKNIGILYKARPYFNKRVCYGSTTHIFTPT